MEFTFGNDEEGLNANAQLLTSFLRSCLVYFILNFLLNAFQISLAKFDSSDIISPRQKIGSQANFIGLSIIVFLTCNFPLLSVLH